MDRTVNYVPLPAEYIYRTLGPVRQKLSRVLLYIVQSFTDRDMDTETYLACHSVVGAAWRRMNDDSEFCEQLELDLPTRDLPPFFAHGIIRHFLHSGLRLRTAEPVKRSRPQTPSSL